MKERVVNFPGARVQGDQKLTAKVSEKILDRVDFRILNMEGKEIFAKEDLRGWNLVSLTPLPMTADKEGAEEAGDEDEERPQHGTDSIPVTFFALDKEAPDGRLVRTMLTTWGESLFIFDAIMSEASSEEKK